MKLFKIKYLAALLAVSLLTSCVGFRSSQSIRSASMYPSSVELKTTLDDYKLLGTEQVTVSYKVYFGLFSFLNEINGQEASYRNVNIVNFNSFTGVGILDNKLKRAVFAGMVKHADVEFIVPVSVVTEKENMFCGKNVKKTLRFKMYKLNDK